MRLSEAAALRPWDFPVGSLQILCLETGQFLGAPSRRLVGSGETLLGRLATVLQQPLVRLHPRDGVRPVGSWVPTPSPPLSSHVCQDWLTHLRSHKPSPPTKAAISSACPSVRCVLRPQTYVMTGRGRECEETEQPHTQTYNPGGTPVEALLPGLREDQVEGLLGRSTPI